jgi:hypothetical protein
MYIVCLNKVKHHSLETKPDPKGLAFLLPGGSVADLQVNLLLCHLATLPLGNIYL